MDQRLTRVAPAADRHLAAVERFLQVAVRSGLGPRSHLRAGRDLPAGHGVDLVVHQDDGDVDVPPRGVEKVVPPDRQAVPVAGENHDLAGRPGGLQPDGRRDGAAVEDLEDVRVDVHGNPRAAADPGREGQVVDDAQVVHGVQECLDDYPVPAARAEDERKEVLPEVFFTEWVHRFSSRNRRNSCGCG